MGDRALGDRIAGAPQRLTGPQPVDGTNPTVSAEVEVAPLLRSKGSQAADTVFYLAMLACGLTVLALVGVILYQLITKSDLSWHSFGWRFFFSSEWDPVNDKFGALPFIYGTVVSSLVAMVLAVPLAVGVAIFITEMSPQWLRGPLAFVTELLAAIPSVIYGLWAIFVLVPLLRLYVQPWLAHRFGWTGLFGGPSYGIGMLAAGIILAVMVIPIISSITREVMTAVPRQQREAVLALGATRWEMIRTGVLRNARAGILGGIILGLGRALGETMAVTMVIGNRPEIAKSLFAPGYPMASVIANEFGEATGNIYLSSLVEVGLALFIVTVIVNVLAQLLVWTVTRGTPARANA
ncbi:MAG: phosphate ABC transporter permease subunit PstC [Acidobacteriota bacterium]|nr:phosphate ABC transporter permease subunit PstC [Acidobacteriota bacterium]